jgi:hypothetical protein
MHFPDLPHGSVHLPVCDRSSLFRYGDLPLDDNRDDNRHMGSARAFFTPGIS